MDAFYRRYLRVDRSPGLLVDALTAVALTFLSDKKAHEIQRRISTLSLPLDPLYSLEAPMIELLLVTSEKDLDMLPDSIESALANSLNPISKVIVVTQAHVMSQAYALLANYIEPENFLILSEEELLPVRIRSKLRTQFHSRYGWMLQQFLCLAYVLESTAPGVLVLDSDTLLTRKRLFLSDKKQILTPSLEKHAPYYTFLREVSPIFESTDHSFVSHHMLWQPTILNEILNLICAGDLEQLADLVIARADMSEISPVCVKYELYSRGIISLHEDRVVFAKWSNTHLQRSRLRSSKGQEGSNFRSNRYASVSFHDYL